MDCYTIGVQSDRRRYDERERERKRDSRDRDREKCHEAGASDIVTRVEGDRTAGLVKSDGVTS